jgi:hypothetical protein
MGGEAYYLANQHPDRWAALAAIRQHFGITNPTRCQPMRERRSGTFTRHARRQGRNRSCERSRAAVAQIRKLGMEHSTSKFLAAITTTTSPKIQHSKSLPFFDLKTRKRQRLIYRAPARETANPRMKQGSCS